LGTYLADDLADWIANLPEDVAPTAKHPAIARLIEDDTSPSHARSPVRFLPYGKPAKLPVRKPFVLQG
jgi:hypothetical protein